MDELYAGIEFGGTKTICAVGNASGELVATATIPTTTVDTTLAAVYEFFAGQDSVISIGVGAFGPLNLASSSASYGSMYNTPKAGWTNVPLKQLLEQHFGLPVAIDLDVNCAALGELYYGVAQDVRNFVYLTLGTGIGGGLMINKQIVRGVLNLEMGHMRIPHEPFSDVFQGACTYHGDCLEGIASGYAIQAHYQQKAEEISDENVWNIEATYIAAAINNIMMTVGPEKVVLGGGLMNHEGLLEQVRAKLDATINGYMQFPNLSDYIVKSSGEMNGVLGAIRLALAA